MKKRVLVVTSSFPRHKKDWWAQFILSLYKNFPKNSYEVTVLAPHAPNSKLHEVMEGISVIRFPYFFPFKKQLLTTGSGILHSSKKNTLSRIQVAFFLLAEFAAIIYVTRKKRYDIIHAHWVIPQGLFAVLVKLIFGIPVVVTVHGSDAFGLKKWNFVKKLALAYCSVCTVNSSATKQIILDIHDRMKLELIPMGVNTETFSPKNFSKELRKKFEDGPIILCVGRLIPVKGFRYAIEAMPKILSSFSNAKLLIVGEGPYREQLEAFIKKAKLETGKHVHFLGSIAHYELAKIYASSDILVAPSVTDKKTGETEGQNLAILEALASGISVLASDSGGMKDTIQDKRLLVRQKDADDIAVKIISILSNESMQKEIRKHNMQLIKKKYDWKKVSLTFVDLFDRILSIKK